MKFDVKKKLVCGFLCFAVLASACAGAFLRGAVPHRADAAVAVSVPAEADVRAVADGIIAWKKTDVGAEPDGRLINDRFLEQAGSTPGDWFPIGLGRLGIEDNQAGYLAVIGDNVQRRYDDPSGDRLDRYKATEWHRISLAVLASGGNPRRMGTNGDIDLIADGTYDRTDANGNGFLGRQGINGLIWGLITVDSMFYEIPEDACYTRDDMIRGILELQLADGGWALTGSQSDPDITGMAIQAFAPYYNSEKEYAYRNADGDPISKKVRTAVDEALACMSAAQTSDGDFFSWGMQNCESTVQMLVAVTALGIDPFSDSRFIKTGADGLPNTLYDGMLKYRTASGGFTHSFVNDPENVSAVAGEPNTMASEQALYASAALIRFMRGERRLYDFRAERSEETDASIAAAETGISALTLTSDTEEIKAAYDAYLAVDAAERSYVTNYAYLSTLLALADIPYAEEELDYNGGDAGVEIPTEYFTIEDQNAVRALPDPLTTASRAEVLRLWNKIRNSVEFDGKTQMTSVLEKAKNEIDAILAEIDAVKAEIKEELYPFDWIGLGKRQTVHALYNRYLALSEYDRAQFEASDVEGLLKCKKQVDALFTGLIVGVCCSVAAAGIAVFVVLHIRKRRRLKRANAMRESDE